MRGAAELPGKGSKAASPDKSGGVKLRDGFAGACCEAPFVPFTVDRETGSGELCVAESPGVTVQGRTAKDVRVMKKSVCTSLVPLLAMTAVAVSGCCHRRYDDNQLTSAQNHARDLYAENQQLLAAQMQADQMLRGLDSDKQLLMQHLNNVESQLAAANDRVQNLMAERGELADRYAKALTDGSVMVNSTPANLEAEGFQLDPATGLNKFRSDILFDLGSDLLRPESDPVLAEFSQSVKSGAASGMRILIVGHTDDQRIARPETAQKHPTNWHLSTDRADAVIGALIKLGVSPERMAAMGYSEFQPLEKSTEETARQRNRRVELYVIPNDPNLARWDPATSVR